MAGLTFATCYMFWSFSAQAIADHTFRVALSKESTDIARQRTTAGPFTTFLWRHVAETDDGFLLAYWSIFDSPTKPIQFYHIPRRAELIGKISESRTFSVVEWFSQGWWYAVEDGENLVRVVDLRFNEIPSADSHSQREWDWPFAWRFDLQTPQEESLLSVLPDVDAVLYTLRLLADRIRGGENWYPTSAGITIGVTSTQESTDSYYAEDQRFSIIGFREITEKFEEKSCPAPHLLLPCPFKRVGYY